MRLMSAPAVTELLNIDAGLEMPPVAPIPFDLPSNLLKPSAGVVEKASNLAKDANELSLALWLDFWSGSLKDKATVALAGLAFSTNFVKVRSLLSIPAEVAIYKATNPAVAAMAGAAIHYTWYRGYSAMLAQGIDKAQTTLGVIAKKPIIEKARRLPGLEPGSIQPPPEIKHPVRRFGSYLRRRNERRLTTNATGTATYIALAAIHGQSSEQQKKLRKDTVDEGSVWAGVKTGVGTGILAAIAYKDPEASKALANLVKEPEVVMALTFGPLGLVAGTKAAWRKLKKHNSATELELSEPVLATI
jgi:hypothetical protein